MRPEVANLGEAVMDAPELLYLPQARLSLKGFQSLPYTVKPHPLISFRIYHT